MLIPWALPKSSGESTVSTQCLSLSRSIPHRCSFFLHQWKSPEEQERHTGLSILNEKVDIYALGNILFRFATSKGPWREFASSNEPLTAIEKETIARLKVTKGTMPMVPESTLRLNDPYISAMLEAMEWCYQFKPEERPTAREVARYLKASRKKIDKMLL